MIEPLNNVGMVCATCLPITPNREELDNITKGSIVKISLCGERFWNIVDSVDGKMVTGKVNNDLLFTHIHGLRDGDQITFKLNEIIDIYDGR